MRTNRTAAPCPNQIIYPGKREKKTRLHPTLRGTDGKTIRGRHIQVKRAGKLHSPRQKSRSANSRLGEPRDSQIRPDSALEAERSHPQLIGEGSDRLADFSLAQSHKGWQLLPLPVAEWLRPKYNSSLHWLSPAVSLLASRGATQAGVAWRAVSEPAAGRRWRSQWELCRSS